MTDRSFDAVPASSTARSRRPTPVAFVEDGVLCGIVGATIVAVWFLVLDIARGQPFLTPSLLGEVLFLGESVQRVSTVSAVAVLAYTGFHGMLFLLAGGLIAWIVSVIERNPRLGFVLLLVFLLFQSVLFGLEVTLVPDLLGALGAWAVATASLFAAVGMFWFLLRRRPHIVTRLREGWDE